ncbi:hypothetical protein AJ78_01306 [Emergomyces pasteurianus Ep9510]|uniref:CMP/dCMP-type deaminase domain-containing protein n=1 Tax=Emergomyces pasteurianus Ep9510 TaxID=1447872 RepID=A0A1J9QER9_9EURO|nr:hypothetical protein AJ78_01306 [Emergomyces pasteurianus Ep9510]
MFFNCFLLILACTATGTHPVSASTGIQRVLPEPESVMDAIPFTTRAYWIRRANQALSDLDSPCPVAAFGTAIVNHSTTGELGDLICIGINENAKTGNPALHGKLSRRSSIPYVCSSDLLYRQGT